MNIDLSKYPAFNGNIEDLTLLSGQGFCNENYSFTMDGTSYLLRKFKLQGIDRKFEFKVQNLAYAHNIAAKAILLDEENGLMICEYLHGHHKYVLAQDDLKKLADLLRRLHSIQIDAEALKLEDHFKTQPQEITEVLESIKNYEVENVLCHNDLNPKNIIFAEGVKLIDWEYAAVNDRYFDLATVSVEFHLDAQDENYFLEEYFKDNKEIQAEKLHAYKIIYSSLRQDWFAGLK